MVETPYIFPVIDPTLRYQTVNLDEIRGIGFNGVITNAYLLKKYTEKVVDVHSYLGFDGVIMTDSGAYQILKYGGVDVSNREIVQYQCAIKSDIGVILDVPTSYSVSREEALKSAETTLQRAMEVIDIIESCKDTLWTLPIQGGIYIDVLKNYAKKSTEITGYGYSLYALGSPTTLLENYMLDRIVEMVYAVRLSIEPSYPLHLFGAGHPLVMPFVIALGVDLMDSASYILYAKDRRYMTRRGTYRLEELQYLPCSCPICSKYSVEELKEKQGKELERLLAIHNLYTLYVELKEIKEHIKEGRFWEYLEERARAHPAAKRAFDTIKKYLEYIYTRSPLEKPRGKGLLVLSEESVLNPKIINPRRKVFSEVFPDHTCLIFMPLIKPYEAGYNDIDHLSHYSILKIVKVDTSHTCNIYFYHPILGIIPNYLVDTYPFSQFETYSKYSSTIIKTLVYTIIEYLLKLLKAKDYLRVYIVLYTKIEWQDMFSNLIKRYMQYLKLRRIDVKLIDIAKTGKNSMLY